MALAGRKLQEHTQAREIRICCILCFGALQKMANNNITTTSIINRIQLKKNDNCVKNVRKIFFQVFYSPC